jgi:osmoprotectant transport system permease protein
VGPETVGVIEFLGDVAGWFTTAANWRGNDGIPHRLYEHVAISALALLAGVLVALPVGIVLGHLRRGGLLVLNVANVGRAIPSFGILVIAFFAFGSRLGPEPAFVALVALAIPPIITNAYVGITEVEPDAREVAVAMGMTGSQVLRRVELPLALPLVMAGVRTAGVQVVATATLAAVIAWGGLGRYIIDGFAQRDNVKVFCGALLVAVLSIVVEMGLALLQRLTLSPGLVRRSSPAAPVSALPGAAASLTSAVLDQREEATHAEQP